MPRLRKICVIAAFVGAALALALARAPAAEVEKEALRRIENEIDQGHARRDLLDARASEIAVEISALQVALIAGAAKAQNMEDVVSGVQSRLTGLAAEALAKKAHLSERRADLAATLGALARLGRRPLAAMVAAPGAAIDTVRGSILLAAVAPALGAEAQALGVKIEALAFLRDKIDAEAAALVDARRALGKEQRAIERLVRRKAGIQRRNVAERTAESRRLAVLAGEAADVRTLLSKLRAAGEVETRADFAAGRGTMPFPARGRLTERFGERTTSGTLARGVTIETQSGAQVIAPHDGRVVFAGPFRSYGQLLIIAHGERYHTLLAGLSRVSGVVGQRVLAGEPVGWMSEGDGVKPLLYVEVRRDGEPVNPLAWLAASVGKVSG